MAGGNIFAKNFQKGKTNSAFDKAEVYNAPNHDAITDISSILNGVLRPGETIDFTREIKSSEKPKFDNYLQKEKSLFINPNQNETETEIKHLQQEIKSLTPITEGLNKDISNVSLANVPEANRYQLGFFQRIKKIIDDQRQNISNSDSWTETFNHRKNKRFWNKFQNKSGGTQYLNSSEHAVARSAN